jgi:hypothetical protein
MRKIISKMVYRRERGCRVVKDRTRNKIGKGYCMKPV